MADFVTRWSSIKIELGQLKTLPPGLDCIQIYSYVVNLEARNVNILANLAERFLYVIAQMKFILEENVWNEIILNKCLKETIFKESACLLLKQGMHMSVHDGKKI